MQVADKNELSTNHRWCWIGERNSAYLERLTDELAKLRPMNDDDTTIEVSLICVESSAKLGRVLAKTPADFFVWSVPDSGIADRLAEVDVCRRLHYHSQQIMAGLASPSERLLMMEAGCCWHVEQPHQWQACLAKLSVIGASTEEVGWVKPTKILKAVGVARRTTIE